MLQLVHKNFKAWQKGIALIKEVYLITGKFPREELYGLILQIRRAAVSITSNIAEGASRKSTLERKRFYEIARSSLVEIDTQIEISYELGYLKHEKTINLEKNINDIFALLTAMINNTR